MQVVTALMVEAYPAMSEAAIAEKVESLASSWRLFKAMTDSLNACLALEQGPWRISTMMFGVSRSEGPEDAAEGEKSTPVVCLGLTEHGKTDYPDGLAIRDLYRFQKAVKRLSLPVVVEVGTLTKTWYKADQTTLKSSGDQLCIWFPHEAYGDGHGELRRFVMTK